MTRINTIPVELLTDQHAMSEYRELPMVNASLARTLRSKRGLVVDQIPIDYTLNSGHVMFHYNKGLYLFNRYHALIDELNSRQYNVKPDERSVDWEVFKQHSLWNDWQPTLAEQATNVQRIVERIKQKTTWYRYKGQQMNDDLVYHLYNPYISIEV